MSESKENLKIYGADRSIEPRDVLPTTAWKVDNRPVVERHEMRVRLRRMMIEPTSFKQISAESGGDPDRIRHRIMDIVNKRGKMHNPITGTGGVLYGVVDEIGPEYENKSGLQKGDKVMCNSSLASIPLAIESIGGIDTAFGLVDVAGSAIIFSRAPVVKKPEGIPANLLMYLSNESGTLYNVSKAAKGKKDFLIVGDHIIANLIFGRAIRKAAGEEARIVCLVDKGGEGKFRGSRIPKLLSETFDEIHSVEIHKPTACIAELDLDNSFDLAVNCADIPGGETINVVATRNGGMVVFANIINRYGEALYMTEAISRDIDVRVADGYLEKYADFDLEFAAEIAPAFEDVIYEDRAEAEGAGKPQPKTAEGGILMRFEGVADDFICESDAMESSLRELLRVAKYDCNVLITGETGVGKEKAAFIIYKNSARNMRPFIRVNCAAISPHLLESEFFGYEKGAFTGASDKGRRGYFELADMGTIFLDEIAELPLDLQAKLLRALQDGEFYKVGGSAPMRANVRIISATNKDPAELLESGGFRRDLYYRLNVFPVRVPGLGERRKEIPALAAHFINMYNAKFGLRKTISPEAVRALGDREWPGNIRELENMVQRLLISSEGEEITLEDVMGAASAGGAGCAPGVRLQEGAAGADGFMPGNTSLSRAVEAYEDKLISEAYREYGSSRKASAALGISQSSFMRRKRRLEERGLLPGEE